MVPGPQTTVALAMRDSTGNVSDSSQMGMQAGLAQGLVEMLFVSFGARAGHTKLGRVTGENPT